MNTKPENKRPNTDTVRDIKGKCTTKCFSHRTVCTMQGFQNNRAAAGAPAGGMRFTAGYFVQYLKHQFCSPSSIPAKLSNKVIFPQLGLSFIYSLVIFENDVLIFRKTDLVICHLIVDFVSLFNARFPSSLQTCQLRFQVQILGVNFATKIASTFQCLNYCKQMFIVQVEINSSKESSWSSELPRRFVFH
jgi:hypothetical protein